MINEIHLQTKKHAEMIDITAQVQNLLSQENVQEGIAIVFSSHTTAGITINENADPDVQRDFLRRLDEIYPWDDPKDRHIEGNSAAHLKASTVGTSQTVIIHNINCYWAGGRGFIFVSLMVQGSGRVI